MAMSHQGSPSKFNKDFKNGPHQKKKKIQREKKAKMSYLDIEENL